MTQTTASNQQTSLLNATLLVSGTCIGGGMLALPVVSGQPGFIPSIVAMFIAWIAMTATALCLIELCLWLGKKNIHVISLAEHYLGTWGKSVAWVLFLFMSYASLIAYVAGSGHLLAQGISSLGLFCSQNVGCLLFILLFGPFVFLPHAKLAKANSLLFYAMIITYMVIIATGVSYIKEENIQHRDWMSTYKAIPLILTSFSFQTMAPSLLPLLGYKRKKLWLACSIGTLIPFLVYVLWQWVILGAVPIEGKDGLLEAYRLGEPATYSLSAISHTPLLTIANDFFSFFVLVTPFLGLTMGLFDFLADGFHIQRNTKGRIILTTLVLVPTLFSALYFERIFLTALDFSGGFGDSILNGLLPIFMVWSGASLYLKKKKPEKALLYSGLLLLSLVFLSALGCELYTQVTSGSTIYDTKVVDIIEMEK